MTNGAKYVQHVSTRNFPLRNKSVSAHLAFADIFGTSEDHE